MKPIILIAICATMMGAAGAFQYPPPYEAINLLPLRTFGKFEPFVISHPNIPASYVHKTYYTDKDTWRYPTPQGFVTAELPNESTEADSDVTSGPEVNTEWSYYQGQWTHHSMITPNMSNRGLRVDSYKLKDVGAIVGLRDPDTNTMFFHVNFPPGGGGSGTPN
jgi:hypothetical protein